MWEEVVRGVRTEGEFNEVSLGFLEAEESADLDSIDEKGNA